LAGHSANEIAAVSDVFPTAPAPVVTRLEPTRSAEIVDHLLPARSVRPPRLASSISMVRRGTGAVTCFQGLLTNDIEKPGDGAFVYGALLTPRA